MCIRDRAWTVGVVLGSNELGLTQEEVSSLPADELEARKDVYKRQMEKCAASISSMRLMSAVSNVCVSPYSP